MRNDLGCTRAYGNVPSRPSLPPPRTSLGRSSVSSTLRAPQSETERCLPNLHGHAPPSLAAWVGFGHGKTTRIWGTEALPPVIPHEGPKLGAPSQRWGKGCSYQTRTHTSTSSETKGKSKVQLLPLRLHRLNHYPLGVWGST